MKYIISLFLVLIVKENFAQFVTSPYLNDHLQNALLAAQRGQYSQVGNFKVAGSSLFMEDEFPGEVYIDNGGVFNQGKFAYNLYTHQVQMNFGGKKGEIKSVIRYFTLKLPSEKVLTFINTDSINCKKKGFLLELITGKNVNLYRYTFCSLVENPNFFSAEYRLFDASTEYYVSVSGQAPKLVKPNKKNILKHLGGSQKIDDFIEEQKIDFGKEVDISKIFAYANTL